jgi:hypothetical protein
MVERKKGKKKQEKEYRVASNAEHAADIKVFTRTFKNSIKFFLHSNRLCVT